jgi:hypothetical protein
MKHLIFILLLCAISTAAQIRPPHDRLRVLRNVTIEPGETVNDVQCFVCSIRVLGHVSGDIITVGGGIVIDGAVDGDAIAVGGGIETRAQAKLSGDAIAVGGYVQKNGGGIGGEALGFPYIIIPGQLSPTVLGSLSLAALNLFLVGLAYAVLREQRVESAARAITERNGAVLAAGLFGFGFFYCLNWMCTHLGSAQDSAEIALGAVFLAIAAAGATGLGFWAAKFAFPNTKGVVTTLTGILALTFLELVPLLGFVVAAVGLLISFGAFLVSFLSGRPRSAPAV